MCTHWFHCISFPSIANTYTQYKGVFLWSRRANVPSRTPDQRWGGGGGGREKCWQSFLSGSTRSARQLKRTSSEDSDPGEDPNIAAVTLHGRESLFMDEPLSDDTHRDRDAPLPPWTTQIARAASASQSPASSYRQPPAGRVLQGSRRVPETAECARKPNAGSLLGRRLRRRPGIKQAFGLRHEPGISNYRASFEREYLLRFFDTTDLLPVMYGDKQVPRGFDSTRIYMLLVKYRLSNWCVYHWIKRGTTQLARKL